jgi:ribonuclease HII
MRWKENQLQLPKDAPRRFPNFAAERTMAGLHGGPVAGIDEAGRGPWAGPVVAAAVVLDIERRAPNGLNDSKQLTEAQREVLYGVVTRRALAWGVGLADVGEIDAINIRQATHLAMRRAMEAMYAKGHAVCAAIVDGDDLPPLAVPAKAMVDGDARAYAIAAASIIAKVTRDRMMADLDAAHPGYGFAQHKGYGTRAHAAALKALGPCPIHRSSFAPVYLARTQLDLFPETVLPEAEAA